MEKKKERLKQLIAESDGVVERVNKVLKHIKPADTSKVVLTSNPFAEKRERLSLTK